MKWLYPGKHFPRCVGPSTACNFHVNSRKSAKKSNLSNILCISLLSASLIKTEASIIQTAFFSIICLWETNSHVKSPTCPQIELVKDFMVVLITCKSDEDFIKNEMAIIPITFF